LGRGKRDRWLRRSWLRRSWHVVSRAAPLVQAHGRHERGVSPGGGCSKLAWWKAPTRSQP
jgi:hypothetical protein